MMAFILIASAFADDVNYALEYKEIRLAGEEEGIWISSIS